MTNFFNGIKNLINKNKKEVSLKDAFETMSKEIEKATNSYDKNFFPEEEVLSPEEIHYSVLNLPAGSNFEIIQKKYTELKSKYNPEENQEELSRLEYAYKYFKQKFDIN